MHVHVGGGVILLVLVFVFALVIGLTLLLRRKNVVTVVETQNPPPPAYQQSSPPPYQPPPPYHQVPYRTNYVEPVYIAPSYPMGSTGFVEGMLLGEMVGGAMQPRETIIEENVVSPDPYAQNDYDVPSQNTENDGGFWSVDVNTDDNSSNDDSGPNLDYN